MLANCTGQKWTCGRRSPQIEIIFTDTGKQRFAEVTRECRGKRLAIIVGGQLYSVPKILTEIADGRAQISGHFSELEARDLAAKITEPLPKQ
jgi:SecD/SecF fusion protein